MHADYIIRKRKNEIYSKSFILHFYVSSISGMYIRSNNNDGIRQYNKDYEGLPKQSKQNDLVYFCQMKEPAPSA